MTIPEALAAQAPEIITALIVSVVIPFAGGVAYRWAHRQEWAKTVGIDAIAAGVDAAWERVGRELKEASADGKFSDAERARLRETAKREAILIAKAHGVDLIKSFGQLLIDKYIKDAVQARKAASPAPSLVVEPVKPALLRKATAPVQLSPADLNPKE